MGMTDAPFSIAIIGSESGEKWVGDFRAKERLSHRDFLRKDQIRRELLGPATAIPSERALSLAVIVAELTVRLTKMPKWLEEAGVGLDLEDENVIVLIYNKTLEVEQNARELKLKAAEEAKAEIKKQVEEDEKK